MFVNQRFIRLENIQKIIGSLCRFHGNPDEGQGVLGAFCLPDHLFHGVPLLLGDLTQEEKRQFGVVLAQNPDASCSPASPIARL